MSGRSQKRARYDEAKGKSAYLKGQKSMVVRMVPRSVPFARSYRGPLPNKVSTVLKYTNRVSVNAGAGAWAGNVYSANGIFQCDTTAAAGQPRGRDEMFELYNHAYVTASYISVRTVGNDSDALLWGVAVRDDAVAFTDMRDFAEYRNSKFKLVYTTPPALDQPIRHKCSPHKFLGLKDAFDDSLRNSLTSGPTEAVFYHVGCADLTGSDPGACWFIVSIVYYVTFTEPKPLAAS